MTSSIVNPHTTPDVCQRSAHYSHAKPIEVEIRQVAHQTEVASVARFPCADAMHASHQESIIVMPKPIEDEIRQVAHQTDVAILTRSPYVDAMRASHRENHVLNQDNDYSVITSTSARRGSYAMHSLSGSLYIIP